MIPHVYNNRGLAYGKSGHYELPVADFTHAIELEADNVDAINQRALSFYFERRYDEAWADVRKDRELRGETHPELIRRLAEATGRSE